MKCLFKEIKMLNKFLFKYLKEIKLSIIDRGKRKN
jgi:hypothetical protein